MNDARSRVAYRTKKAAGFTIVETLIVLAVTMALFISAVALVSGQQNRVQFSQSVNDIKTNIQKTINEIGAGYYPNTGNMSCSGGGGVLTIAAGSTAQGSNTGCIFLGKAIQFGVGSTDPQQYIVHSIAGLQDNTGTLASARPKDIAPGLTTNNSFNFPNFSEVDTLHNGLTAYSMRYIQGPTSTNISAVAFVSQLGSYNSSSDLMSGTQQIDLVPVVGSGTVGSSTSTGVSDAINNNLATSPVNPSGGVEICFQSGTTKQSGLVKIGGNGRTLSVTLDIKGSKDCS